MAKTEIKIAVEKVVIHDALKEMIQKIRQQADSFGSNPPGRVRGQRRWVADKVVRAKLSAVAGLVDNLRTGHKEGRHRIEWH